MREKMMKKREKEEEEGVDVYSRWTCSEIKSFMA